MSSSPKNKQGKPQKKNKQDARSRQTTGDLIREARRLFAEQGYAQTSAEQIVAAAGVTRGALYHHFDGKKGLFRAVVEQTHAEISRRVEIATADCLDPVEMLIAGNSEFLAACLDPGIRRILLMDAPSVLPWEEWRAMDEANVLGEFRETLRMMMEKGVLRPMPVDALAQIISGAANDAALWASQAEEPETALAQAQETMAYLIRTLRA